MILFTTVSFVCLQILALAIYYIANTESNARMETRGNQVDFANGMKFSFNLIDIETRIDIHKFTLIYDIDF